MAAPVVGDKAVVQEGSAVGLVRRFANTTHKMGIVVPHKGKKKETSLLKGCICQALLKMGMFMLLLLLIVIWILVVSTMTCLHFLQPLGTNQVF